MRSRTWIWSLPLLGGTLSSAYAQDNQDLTPYIDTRLGGVFLSAGRGSPDNDADLIFARESFDENFGAQSLYFRVFDGTNDNEAFHLQVDLRGASVQNTFTDAFSLASGDFLIGVGDTFADYGGFNAARGLELQDTLLRSADNASFAAVFSAGAGIDDFRVSVLYPDLDPGGLTNRGSASLVLRLFAGGATSPLGANLPSGTAVGVIVGDDTTNSTLDDGVYSVNNVEPEGSGGFNNPSRTQTITLRLLFEDLDVVEDGLSFPAVTAGQNTSSLAFTIDNFGQGADLDNDNGLDANGGLLVIPNLSLERIKALKGNLQGPGNAQIPASAVQVSTDLGRLDVGALTAVQARINVPVNTPPGNYSGLLTLWEDNNNNGVVDPTETFDTLTLSVAVQSSGGQDADNDGLLDSAEDPNGNGLVDPGETDPNNPDTDNDGLQDGLEVNGQNPTDPLDPDSDNDGLQDGAEDQNANGQVNNNETDPNDPDTDNGGESDGSEVLNNRNPRNPADDIAFDPNADNDNDGLRNGLEDKNGNGVIDAGETNPNNPDSDQDALPDGVEDADQDGLRDPNETDPTDQDSDNDALLDGTEVLGSNQTDPLDADTDDDGLQDGCEDRNQNGTFNAGELNPNLLDTDLDGIPDGNEDLDGDCSFDADSDETDPTDPDTDDGGESDGSEVDGGRDPRDPADDLQSEDGIFVIGGGACAVGSSSLNHLWLLLLVGALLSRRRSGR